MGRAPRVPSTPPKPGEPTRGDYQPAHTVAEALERWRGDGLTENAIREAHDAYALRREEHDAQKEAKGLLEDERDKIGLFLSDILKAHRGLCGPARTLLHTRLADCATSPGALLDQVDMSIARALGILDTFDHD